MMALSLASICGRSPFSVRGTGSGAQALATMARTSGEAIAGMTVRRTNGPMAGTTLSRMSGAAAGGVGLQNGFTNTMASGLGAARHDQHRATAAPNE